VVVVFYSRALAWMAIFGVFKDSVTNFWVEIQKIGVGTPKWMVKIMENPIKGDDLGRTPTIFGNIHISRDFWL